MKFKFLLASAVAIVGIAVYTLTLSFTHSAPLLSQLEALADGEGGDGGNTGGESGEGSEGENPESGQKENGEKSKEAPTEKYCPQFEITREWTVAPDGTGGWSTHEQFMGMAWVPMVICVQGSGTCTPYMPC